MPLPLLLLFIFFYHHLSLSHKLLVFNFPNLKLGELLSSLATFTLALNFQDIETDSLGQGTAFPDGNDITDLDTNEGRRTVRSQVLVSLLVTVVLLDVVQVFTTDNDGTFHLGANNGTGKDTTANRNVSSEWAFLVNVGTSDGFLGGNET